jgi:predicted AAA+ superfamily ATPase
MKRERNFKIYLNNPSMRAALFAPVSASDAVLVGHLTESAIFSQWQHSAHFRNIRYARWRNEGEVDIVFLSGAAEKPSWIGEIKWSDRVQKNQLSETKSLQILLRRHSSITESFFTSKTLTSESTVECKPFKVVPSAIYCYTVGRNITQHLAGPFGIEFSSATKEEEAA